MSCPETREGLHAYLDDELDSERRTAFQEHLRGCAECSRELETQRALRTGLRAGPFRFAAPAGLAGRVRASLRETASMAPPRRALWPWLAAAAVVAAAVFAGARAYWETYRNPESVDLPRELVSAHVRSLMAQHLYDVPSTDRHTVKPWFEGKVDFSPPVKDIKEMGFPLEGGRLDYLDDRPVAALVYARRKHVINLFVWPAAGGGDSPARTESRRGYNLLHWTKDGLNFWAVSDLNADDLDEFGRLQRDEAP